jgi:hypothetical protein
MIAAGQSGDSGAEAVKAIMMRHIRQLVADGFADWATLDDGEILLRFHTGETFLLAQTAIVRLA